MKVLISSIVFGGCSDEGFDMQNIHHEELEMRLVTATPNSSESSDCNLNKKENFAVKSL